MGAREDMMRDEGVDVCPDWCVQGDVEWEAEQHVGAWCEVTGAAWDASGHEIGVVFQVRPRMTWWPGQDDEVEIACSVAGQIRLSADFANKLSSAISDAHGDLTYYQEIEAYDEEEEAA